MSLAPLTQEFVQRVHARGVVRKRVIPFRLGAARGAGCLASVPLEAGRSVVFEAWEADESLHSIGKASGAGRALCRHARVTVLPGW